MFGDEEFGQLEFAYVAAAAYTGDVLWLHPMVVYCGGFAAAVVRC